MSGLFYNLGRRVGPKVRKAKWIWHSIAGTEAETINIENQVGIDLARQIRMQIDINNNPEIEKMLNETGQLLQKCVANKSRTFNFEAIAEAEPNAFALPGGFVFVTRSIIDLCNWDQDETAFILGHEMAHVIRKHAINRIMRDFAVNAASRVTPARGAVTGWIKRVGIQYLESSYSHELEFEADTLGVRLIHAAGFNPEASISLLKRLSELKSSPNQFELGNYFSTHPSFPERIGNIRELLRKSS